MMGTDARSCRGQCRAPRTRTAGQSAAVKLGQLMIEAARKNVTHSNLISLSGS